MAKKKPNILDGVSIVNWDNPQTTSEAPKGRKAAKKKPKAAPAEVIRTDRYGEDSPLGRINRRKGPPKPTFGGVATTGLYNSSPATASIGYNAVKPTQSVIGMPGIVGSGGGGGVGGGIATASQSPLFGGAPPSGTTPATAAAAAGAAAPAVSGLSKFLRFAGGALSAYAILDLLINQPLQYQRGKEVDRAMAFRAGQQGIGEGALEFQTDTDTAYLNQVEQGQQIGQSFSQALQFDEIMSGREAVMRDLREIMAIAYQEPPQLSESLMLLGGR